MPDDYTGLLSGSNWNGIEVSNTPTFVTFSFPTTANAYVAGITDPGLNPAALATWTAFSAAEATMARAALAEWGAACGVTFIEVAPGQGDINFQKLDFTGTAYDGAGGIGYHAFGDWNFFSSPYFRSDLDSSGDIFMNSDVPIIYGTLLHEIGHSLGLKHPTEVWTDFAANPPVVHNVWSVDDPNLTIMSQLPGGTGHLTAIDIQAIQSIYGTDAQDGTQVASWSWNATTQTLTQTGYATADAVRGSSVKDVINGMDGDDRLFGLNGNDSLYGGNGNDSLEGGPGSDKLFGGAGDDVYFLDATGDAVTESAGQGNDIVYSTLTRVLAANVEDLYFLGNLKVTGTGNALANQMFAGGGAAALKGLGGDDYIIGGALNDSITGGTGADYVFGNGGADQFMFTTTADFAPDTAPDAIGDFSSAQRDKINLKAIDPNTALAGDQAFSFVGTAAFTVDARFQVRYQVEFGTQTRVQIDLNHDTVADLSLILYTIVPLTAADFTL